MKNALSFSSGNPGTPDLDVWTVNVGRGNCVIVKFTNGKYMLVDAGSKSTEPGETAILADIDQIMGGNNFTTVVLTHPDDDHCNLVPLLRQADKPTYVHIGLKRTDYDSSVQTWFSTVEGKGSTIQTYVNNYFDANAQTDFGNGSDTQLYILAANVNGDTNTKSIVLSIDFNNHTVILTGDATATTERFILSKWDDMSLMGTLLGFGHHGSSHSSSKKFLDTVKADVGIFSANAQHMGYGHPRCSVYNEALSFTAENGKDGMLVQNHRIECWDASSSSYVYYNIKRGIFLTATQGDILFTSDGSKYRVDTDALLTYAGVAP